ncbi:hypothetical protein [Methyloceanibacter marginalis]|uniref:hypothetical protein n=1 Tax=Methyloceanibacter marginalis TaxID=1774971 RepID=UPI000A48A286|nr:hypothetical protein [Methyloceanibacter marginalis]
MFGLALLYAKRGPALSIFAQAIALIMLAQVLIVVAGHVYGVDTSNYPFPFTPLTAYGAASVVLLAVGFIAASPERGIAAAIVEQSPAGEMLRRLLPGILVLPLVIGWFVRQAELRASTTAPRPLPSSPWRASSCSPCSPGPRSAPSDAPTSNVRWR